MDFIDNMKHIVKGQRKRRETLATLPGLTRKKVDIIEELDEGDEDNIAEGMISLESSVKSCKFGQSAKLGQRTCFFYF